jgi:hypothetical protein
MTSIDLKSESDSVVLRIEHLLKTCAFRDYDVEQLSASLQEFKRQVTAWDHAVRIQNSIAVPHQDTLPQQALRYEVGTFSQPLRWKPENLNFDGLKLQQLHENDNLNAPSLLSPGMIDYTTEKVQAAAESCGADEGGPELKDGSYELKEEAGADQGGVDRAEIAEGAVGRAGEVL